MVKFVGICGILVYVHFRCSCSKRCYSCSPRGPIQVQGLPLFFSLSLRFNSTQHLDNAKKLQPKSHQSLLCQILISDHGNRLWRPHWYHSVSGTDLSGWVVFAKSLVKICIRYGKYGIAIFSYLILRVTRSSWSIGYHNQWWLITNVTSITKRYDQVRGKVGRHTDPRPAINYLKSQVISYYSPWWYLEQKSYLRVSA